jgi:hypothetical protein
MGGSPLLARQEQKGDLIHCVRSAYRV